jgi:hypothetical protein
MVLRDELN